MRDNDDLPYVVIERRSAGLGMFFWGAILGAGAALLLAPRTGEETQRTLRDGYLKARRTAEDTVDQVKSTVDTTRTRINTVRDQIDDKTVRAKETLDSARRAARDARAELERKVNDVRGNSNPPAKPDPGAPASTGSEVFVTDVSDEQTEGRADLG